jgi:TPR repeat protein
VAVQTQGLQTTLQSNMAAVSSGPHSPTNGPEDRTSSPSAAGSTRRKSVPSTISSPSRSHPLNNIDEQNPYQSPEPAPGSAAQYQKQLPHFSGQYSTHGRVMSLQSNDSRDSSNPSPDLIFNRKTFDPALQDPLPSPRSKPQHMTHDHPIPQPQKAVISSGESRRSSKSSSIFRTESPISGVSEERPQKPAKLHPQLQYHHQQANGSTQSVGEGRYTGGSQSPASDVSPGLPPQGSGPGALLAPQAAYRRGSPRPVSTYSLGPESRGRSPSGVPPQPQRAVSYNWDARRSSYMDLTQPAHMQEQLAPRPVSQFDNSHLQVGAFASLMSPTKTLEMYRLNAKKTQEPMLQYDLAVFMVQLAQQLPDTPAPSSRRKSSGDTSNPAEPGALSRKELLKEARDILERTQSKLPQAQYYLADAYSSGLFNKGNPENEKAFPLFVAASKHGHAEAGYRAALCYEFGWGCRRDPLKAVQFFRHAASKSHPGAMTRLGIACLREDLGLQGAYREGLKWLKRATEIADEQYPAAPYELGCLHEKGYGESVLPDPGYSAQLFTQAAELGHAEASFRMGDAYEHGKLMCPKDPALSVHFYTGAAQRGHPLAMMALCAWYLVGAEPVLEKNEAEAYAWALKATEHGLSSPSPPREEGIRGIALMHHRPAEGGVCGRVLYGDGNWMQERHARG